MLFIKNIASILELTLLATHSWAAAVPASDLEKRYTAGWCGFHIHQYDVCGKGGTCDGNFRYSIEVTVKDATGAQIGYVGRTTAGN